MVEHDFDDFVALIDQSYALQSQRVLTAEAKAIFFATIAEHPIVDVRRAVFAHLKDPVNGRFPVQPSHIEAQIAAAKGGDGRPGADEAWALALRSVDERSTVVWTTEAFEAFQIARSVLEGGDEVGARMAFKDAYNRLVAQARVARRAAAWQPSLGWDADEREKALREAVVQNRLAAPMVAALLPAPDEASDYDERKARENLQRIREFVSTIPSALERIAALRAKKLADEHDQVAARKDELRQQAEKHGVTSDGYQEIAPT